MSSVTKYVCVKMGDVCKEFGPEHIITKELVDIIAYPTSFKEVIVGEDSDVLYLDHLIQMITDIDMTEIVTEDQGHYLTEQRDGLKAILSWMEDEDVQGIIMSY